MKRPINMALALVILVMLTLSLISPAAAQTPIVNAVLFYSPTCPHCHKVMTEDLPPLRAKYGDQLQILEVNVQLPDGQQLYNEYLLRFNVPEMRRGVPALVVGDTYMVGSVEIPEMFPGLIVEGLARGGVDWPDIPGLDRYLTEHGLAPREQLTFGQRFGQDPLGNSISTLVLVGMVVSVVLAWNAYASGSVQLSPWPAWTIPVLALIGTGVALYLSIVEITHVEALCGPVGDCNAVQTSQYAYLFGVIPVGLLGVGGFLAIGGAWAMRQFGKKENRRPATLALWWLALGGTLFSIYLTFLEPFVIGATCAWCITSALAMTLLLWAATPEVIQVRFRSRRRGYRKFRARGAR